jgi:hypothetical protein
MRHSPCNPQEAFFRRGDAAKGASVRLEEIDATAEEEEDAGVEAVEEGLISDRYQLRPQSAVTINLPADLTKTEAERLARFIQSLPFGA